MRWIRFGFSLPLCNHLLTAIQHYKTKHRFECPKCNREFVTQGGMDKVASYPMIPDFVLVLTRPFSTTKQNIPLLYAPSAAASLTPRRGWIKFAPNHVLGDHTLTLFQHYNTKHRFGCPKCNEVFTTQAAMDLVLFSPIALRLDFSPASAALRCEAPPQMSSVW